MKKKTAVVLVVLAVCGERHMLWKTIKRNMSSPMGVSQWKKHGKKHGYWKYFIEENDTKWRARIGKLITFLEKLPDDEPMTKRPVILELKVLRDNLLQGESMKKMTHDAHWEVVKARTPSRGSQEIRRRTKMKFIKLII